MDKQIPIFEGNPQTGIIRFRKLTLTEFGRLFTKACVPERFIILK